MIGKIKFISYHTMTFFLVMTTLLLIIKHLNFNLGNFDNVTVLVKRWEVSFEDAIDNPNYRYQIDKLIVHQQWDVSICCF